MSSVLEELWYGNIEPQEQFLSGNTHFKELVSIMAKDREKLTADFTLEQNEWLEKYDDIINEMHSTAEVEAFKYGFRLAIELMNERTIL